MEYLVFEGGGGKGMAYIGALEALEEANVLVTETDELNRRRLGGKIHGVAGSSAGAITALLVSLGYTSKELRTYLTEEPTRSYERCLTPPTPRRVPVIGGTAKRRTGDHETDLAACIRRSPIGIALEMFLDLVDLMGAKETEMPKLLKLLREHWPEYLAYLIRDMGLFDGDFAHREFERLLRERLTSPLTYLNLPSPPKPITFWDHWMFTGERVKLLVTSSNLTTGRTVLFSKDDTPRFPVADAVRMSMGFPFAFKPYVIGDEYDGRPPAGTYVDGGVYNNLPYREFDDVSGGSAVARTLGLRLDIEANDPVLHFFAFARRFLETTVRGAGETQVIDKYVDRMIDLDTTGLSTLDFNPPRDKRDAAIKKAKAKTLAYFGGTI